MCDTKFGENNSFGFCEPFGAQGHLCCICIFTEEAAQDG
jgi:hypothetical protein